MAVIATGFFDGVHLGHRKVIDTLLQTARGRGEQSVVVTFWPHPRTVLQDDARSLRLLSSLQEKKDMLVRLGVDRVEVLDFSRDFSRLTAEQYLRDVLISRLGCTAVVLGYDHRFGSDGLSRDALVSLATSLGLDVIDCDAVSFASSEGSSPRETSAAQTPPQAVPPLMVPRVAQSPEGNSPQKPEKLPRETSAAQTPPQAVPPLMVPRVAQSPEGNSPQKPEKLPRETSAAQTPPQAVPPLMVPRVAQSPEGNSPQKQGGALPAISSTRIRKALENGDVVGAAEMLGYRYGLHGVVVAGNQLGRTIGFPTANMQLYEPLKLVPANGVYLTEVEVLDAQFYGMTNIGVRPTVSGAGVRTIETHILDFDEMIYGLDLKLSFVSKIRDERKFASLEALSAQLAADKAICRELVESSTSQKDSEK